jgi:NAD(P)H dehydrogenase (quinone)
MNKPKILVTSAAGRTGSTTVLELLREGFPVRAFVRSRDARAQALEKAGAELAVGDLFDFRDIRQALVGVQRAYYCPPMSANLLEGAMLFALAAEEAKLEVVGLMSQWQPHPADPSIVSRQHWIANQLYRWMPSVDVIHINPGLFAFFYLLGLPAIVHMGMLMAPFGDGRNAPPSNEDIARVAAKLLANPGPHIGKSYRPTGPELLSPQDIAGILAKVLGRKVRYQDASMGMFSKAAKALGVSDFEISQIRHYTDALRNGAYEIGAPTNHVEQITGRKPESFEATARRYLADPALIDPRLANGGKLAAMAFMFRMLLTRAPDMDRWERDRGHAMLDAPALATDNAEWLASAEKQQLNLLPVGVQRPALKLANGNIFQKG